MFGLNGNRQRVYGLVLVVVDALLVLAGVLGAIFVRFTSYTDFYLFNDYALLRIMFMGCLIQLGFYFCDLYDPRLYYGDRKKMLILFCKSFGTSSAILFAIYYLMPSFQVGRGIFSISLALIFIFSFSWRLLYARIFNSKTFTERVLIIGTGTLAKKIEEELTDNGYHGFEIVGFVDEHRETTEKGFVDGDREAI